MSNCWICGQIADSCEHKIKRSDLVRIFGKPLEISKQGLKYKKHTGDFVDFQGPNSKHVKYEAVICKKCNNETTQNCDYAYDEFVLYAEWNKAEILKRRQICFSDVYGENWVAKQLELFRYFTKSFGCRIADAGRNVPEDFVDIMNSRNFKTQLYVCIAINEDSLADDVFGSLRASIGNIVINKGNVEHEKYAAANFYKWLVFSYWYGWEPFGPTGERWCADREFLCIGSYKKSEMPVSIPRNDGSKTQWYGFEP